MMNKPSWCFSPVDHGFPNEVHHWDGKLGREGWCAVPQMPSRQGTELSHRSPPTEVLTFSSGFPLEQETISVPSKHSYSRIWSQLKNHADLNNSPLFALTLKTNTFVCCFVLFFSNDLNISCCAVCLSSHTMLISFTLIHILLPSYHALEDVSIWM